MWRPALSLLISLCIATCVSAQRYDALIRLPKAAITGICLLETDSAETRGVLMNEFGIKVLAFNARHGKKVRLEYVLPMLDKWYIRATLKKDLRNLLTSQKQADGTVQYTNKRRHITYTLKPIEAPDPTP